MIKGFALLAAAVTATSMLAGCSSDAGNIFNNSLTTSSITPGQPATATTVAAPAQPRVDPLCAALATRIDTLRKDGFTDRLEKVAAGKGTNVQVKRATLGQAAELDRINAEFQAKCSLGPKPMMTQAAAAPVATTVATPGVPVANTSAVVPVPAAPAAKAPAAKPAAAAAAPVVAPPVVQQ